MEMSHAWCSEVLMLGAMVLGVLEVIGGGGEVDRCPGASARAMPRSERGGVGDAAWIMGRNQ